MGQIMSICAPALMTVQIPLSRFYNQAHGMESQDIQQVQQVKQEDTPKKPVNFEDLSLYKTAIMRNWIRNRKQYQLIQNGPHTGKAVNKSNGHTIPICDFIGDFNVVDIGFNCLWGNVHITRASKVIKTFEFNTLSSSYHLDVQECQPHQAGMGGGCWMSSIALLSWMTKNKRMFSGKRVLEMGCGVGLCSLGLATMTRNINVALRPTCIVATDNREVLGEMFDTNTIMNELENKNVSFKLLDWVDENCDFQQSKQSHELFDIIIATDCIYKSTAELFRRTAFKHLAPKGKIIIINPSDDHRPGMYVLLHSLAEYGHVQQRYIDLFMNESYSMELLFVEFTRQ